jgi:hypothetical protein
MNTISTIYKLCVKISIHIYSIGMCSDFLRCVYEEINMEMFNESNENNVKYIEMRNMFLMKK